MWARMSQNSHFLSLTHHRGSSVRPQGRSGHVELSREKSIIGTMHDIPNRIADILLEVEATLRINGKWDESRPDSDALASRQPFCMDTLEFEQWLQWIFLPRMKTTLEETEPLPAKSSIFVYAHECLHKNDPSTGSLLKLIKTFDDLIKIQSSARLH